MHLELSVPVYRRDKWGRLEKDGKIEVSSEVDTLSEGYLAVKKELETLLTQVDIETRLAEDALTLQLEIEEQTRKLTELKKDIERASEHYKSLRLFLEKLGIDPNKKHLTFDKQLLLSSASVSQIDVMAEQSSHEF
jgi:hypothetical protein